MKYCPNCSAELYDEAPIFRCWNCGASFLPPAVWSPTDVPVGKFREFNRIEAKPAETKSRSRLINPFAQVLLRFALGGIAWVALGVLAVLSVLPYGGSSGFGTLFGLSTLALPIWALMPLKRLFKATRGKAGNDGA